MSRSPRGAGVSSRSTERAARARASSAQRAEPVLTRHFIDGELHEVLDGDHFTDSMAFAHGSPNRMAMSVFLEPEEHALRSLAAAWQLHPLLLEDLLHASQRPKLERYGETLFVAVQAPHYVDEREEVEFIEVHLLAKGNSMAVIFQSSRLMDGTPAAEHPAAAGDVHLAGADATVTDAELIRMGPEALIYRILDAIVDGCIPVIRGLQRDKEQIEREVFTGNRRVAERIYLLSQEVIDLIHVANSTDQVVQALARGSEKYETTVDLQAYLHDVSDHLQRVLAEVTGLREALTQILNVNATLVSQRQNEDMKKISGWAAILFAPTLIAAIYGMNFEAMPELRWPLGYPLAVAAMLLFAAVLYIIFKRKNWL